MANEAIFRKKEEQEMRIGVMFTKIDRENRIVSGFATVDNFDSHGDVVSSEGSSKAFKRFRGGLREMHQPNAVGTIVDFEELMKYDEKEGKVYKGIYVNAKVSKGAPQTWEKVLDGTYKGFSIGGKIKKRSKAYTDDGMEYNLIEDYDLIELSLVDNPANPMANVLTVKKVGDTYVYPDIEKQTMNILIHEESGDVILSESEEREGFINIGWTDSADNTENIRLALELYNSGKEDYDKKNEPVLLDEEMRASLPDTEKTYEGGATVATENIENDSGEEVVDSTEQVEKSVETEETVEENAGDEVEKNESTETADPSEEIVSKIQAAVADVLAKATDAAKESKDAADSVKTSFEKSLEDFETKISSLKEEMSKSLEDLAKRVEDVESDTAVKKSADVVGDDAEEDNEEDSFWRGSGFLSANDLFKG